MPDSNDILPMHEILNPEHFGESNVLNILPAAVYVCDVSGRIVNYNAKAVELWGRTPVKNDTEERFCGSFRLYHPDGRHLPPDETPVAACLADGLPRRNLEVIIERPDLTRKAVRVNVAPIKDDQGVLVGMVNCFIDITELSETRRQLDKKTQELQDYIEQAPIGLHWVNKDGIIVWANAAEMEMMGYPPEEYIGQPISKFHVDKKAMADVQERLGRDETVRDFETQLICKDGSLKTVRISSNVLWDGGEFVHTRCFTTDITEQKKAEERISWNEQRYSSITAASSAIIWITSPEGKFETPQHSWENYTGQPWPEHKGVGWELMIHPEDRDAIRNLWADARARKSIYETECKLWSKRHNEYRHISTKAVPLMNDRQEIQEWIGVVTDIHKQKTAESKIAESEYRFRTMAEDAPLWVWMADEKGNVVYANKELREYIGVAAGQPLTRDIWADIIHADDIKKINRGYKQAAAENATYITEARLKNVSTGIYEWFLLKGVPRHERGTLDGFIGTAVNIQQQKDLTFELEKVVLERTIALQEANKLLQRSNEDLLQFAHVASHDLKEPLRKIKLYNSILEQEIGADIDSKAYAVLTKTRRAAERMSNMIEGVLKYSTIEGSDEPLEQIDLNVIVREVLTDLELPISEKKAQVEYANLPVVDGYAILLRQMLYNVINNSLKFSRKNIAPVITITNSGTKKGGQEYLELKIRDNGIGIGEGLTERIFDAFTRLHNKDQYEGNGLGLALCRKIAERHGGEIKAVNNGNMGGATIIITLPQRQVG
ncbi:MAG TPA: PAS domain S-box protein [Flavipsychrobacter sp.]